MTYDSLDDKSINKLNEILDEEDKKEKNSFNIKKININDISKELNKLDNDELKKSKISIDNNRGESEHESLLNNFNTLLKNIKKNPSKINNKFNVNFNKENINTKTKFNSSKILLNRHKKLIDGGKYNSAKNQNLNKSLDYSEEKDEFKSVNVDVNVFNSLNATETNLESKLNNGEENDNSNDESKSNTSYLKDKKIISEEKIISSYSVLKTEKNGNKLENEDLRFETSKQIEGEVSEIIKEKKNESNDKVLEEIPIEHHLNLDNINQQDNLNFIIDIDKKQIELENKIIDSFNDLETSSNLFKSHKNQNETNNHNSNKEENIININETHSIEQNNMISENINVLNMKNNQDSDKLCYENFYKEENLNKENKEIYSNLENNFQDRSIENIYHLGVSIEKNQYYKEKVIFSKLKISRNLF